MYPARTFLLTEMVNGELPPKETYDCDRDEQSLSLSEHQVMGHHVGYELSKNEAAFPGYSVVVVSE